MRPQKISFGSILTSPTQNLVRWFVVVATVTVFAGLSLQAANTLKLLTQNAYLPGLPVLVRVEVLTPQGVRDWSLWDGEAVLTTDVPAVTLSTNRVLLRNGLGSVLVAFRGGTNFNLTATVGAVQASRSLVSVTNLPVTTVGGTNVIVNAVWSGVIRVTNDVTVPTGFSLTILSNTLVLMDGTNSGTVGNDLLIRGRLDCFGTEDMPVTITCGSTNVAFRWGQIRYDTASLTTAPTNTHRYTVITRAGRAPGEGHTGQGPILRPTNAKLVFENSSITDHADMARTNAGVANPNYGTPGKIGFVNGSDLTFNNTLFQRARSGPEIDTTALLFTNGAIMDMLGPDDADGIYIHAQGAGQTCAIKNSVLAVGDDDAIDTLTPTATVDNCIIRGWDNLYEDAKGISVFSGVVTVRRTLIVDCTVGISAKSTAGVSARVNIFESTFTRNGTNVLAQFKSAAPGPIIDYRITNCILWSLGGPTTSVVSDFAPTNFTIGYCNISQPWPGTANLQSDPLFVNSAARDFHLQPFSPSIDTGSPLSPIDPDGSRIDQGDFTFIPGPSQLSQPHMLGNGSHQFQLTAYTNRNYVVEYSTNTTNWTFLLTRFETNSPSAITDAAATNSSMRIYRARLAP